MSQQDVIKIVQNYLNILRNAGIHIDKAYLYGSYARNEATEDSDIDLMLVSKAFDTTNDYVLASPWLYTTAVDHRIEPIAIGIKRFQTDEVSTIIQIVKKEGVEVEF
jgi:predicted nucleotidyltransferase